MWKKQWIAELPQSMLNAIAIFICSSVYNEFFYLEPLKIFLFISGFEQFDYDENLCYLYSYFLHLESVEAFGSMGHEILLPD